MEGYELKDNKYHYFIKNKCSYCNYEGKPYETKYDKSYYREIDFNKKIDILKDELSKNPLYNEALFDSSLELVKQKSQEDLKKLLADSERKRKLEALKNVPKCPTCGSTNIKKISTTRKVVGAGLFGLFSKDATSQFCCGSCGYKW